MFHALGMIVAPFPFVPNWKTRSLHISEASTYTGNRLSYWLKYSELSNKHAANFILFEKFFPSTFIIRTYTFIYFRGKFPPTRLLEPPHLLIFGWNSQLQDHFEQL